MCEHGWQDRQEGTHKQGFLLHLNVLLLAQKDKDKIIHTHSLINRHKSSCCEGLAANRHPADALH